MKLIPTDPPRVFSVGGKNKIEMKDCARIELGCDEQVTFISSSGSEYDVARKNWGYYATPSLNGRLISFGLIGHLIKSAQGKYYIFLVEKDRELEFRSYLNQEQLVSVCRFDHEESLAKLQCLFCGSLNFSKVFHYSSPPEGEIRFSFSGKCSYSRDLFRCESCSHFYSRHEMDMSQMYSEDYVDSTYGDAAGLKKTFEKIVSLDPSRSDNVGRVKNILNFMKGRLQINNPTVMDVGSGLCVFLHRMKAAGWNCLALDPDSRSVQHAQETVGVEGFCGDFMKLDFKRKFDLITFNKVLEHVHDPIAMLAKSASYLSPGGIVYVELPDGECASTEGFGREEFFIDHWHVFSAASISLLAQKAGFKILSVERLREPSSKFTLRAFLVIE